MLQHNHFNLWLIRHGQSEINVQPDMMGQQGNTKLTQLGRKQAELLGQRLKKEGQVFDHVYSSDYLRAHDTARIAIGGKVIIDSSLREYSAGDWTESKRSKILTSEVKLKMGYMNSAFLPPNGESLHQVERRAATWLEQTLLYNQEISGKTNNIAVFSHGMTIKTLLHYVMGFDQNFTWKIMLDNTSITKLSFGDEGWRLICVNDCAHLVSTDI
jgi:broad specificity phosphatase PhoE